MNQKLIGKTKKIEKNRKVSKREQSDQENSPHISPYQRQPEPICESTKFLEIVPQVTELLKNFQQSAPQFSEEQQEPDEHSPDENSVRIAFIQNQVQGQIIKKVQEIRRIFNRSKPNLCETCIIWITDFFTNMYRKVIFYNCMIFSKFVDEQEPTNTKKVRDYYFKVVIDSINADMKSIRNALQTIDGHDKDLQIYRVKSPRNLVFPSEKQINDIYTKSDNEEQADDYLCFQNSQEQNDYVEQLREQYEQSL